MARYRKSSPWSRAIPAALALVFALTFPALSTRDGNGGYSLPSNGFSVPVTGGTLVASDATAVWNDIVAAIAGSLATDGQSTMSGNLKMGSQRITGLAEGTAATDATTVNQIQDNAMAWGGVAGGTADALTLALSPVITAYVDGMTIWFVSSASPNTGATTVNVNSVATDAILKNGSALAAGDIAASKVYAITYYNSDWHLFAPFDLTTAALKAAANTFTAAQTISVTAAGTALTATSSDAGAGAGPNLVLDRNSASPAVSDFLGNVLYNGRDSGGNSTNYAGTYGVILDATDTSEDGRLALRTIRAGSATDWIIDSGAVAAPGMTPKTANGSLNAVELYVSGHGTVAQVVSDTDAVYTTLGTILPVDNTIPQNTEGDEVLSVAITPVNASSILRITAHVTLGANAAGAEVACALFVDATAGAIAAQGGAVQNSTSVAPLDLVHEVSAASTSARTYKIRCGADAATDAFLNGDASARVFGGVAVSSLVVTEVLPQ